MSKTIQVVGYRTEKERRKQKPETVVNFMDNQVATTCRELKVITNIGLTQGLYLTYYTENKKQIRDMDNAHKHLGGQVIYSSGMFGSTIYLDEKGIAIM